MLNSPKSYPLLLKPASSNCNLSCHHCFYTDKKLNNISSGTMSIQTLENVISKYAHLPLDTYSFIWQGGEPALRGHSFYEQAIALQKKYLDPAIPVENYFQTNATLLDSKFVQLMAENNFLVGISIDGPQAMHDFYRVYPNGQGSFKTVLHSYKLLKEYEVRTNALTLISSHNAAHISHIYEWLIAQGFTYQQYIPCVEFNENAQPEAWTVSPEAWGEALCILFDNWIAGACTINIRYFEALLQKIVFNVPGMCQFGNSCLQYAVVEYNGDVYPCDFFVKKELKLGNINTSSWQQILTSEQYISFGSCKMNLHPNCINCEYLSICYGDCQKHRVMVGGDVQAQSWLCKGYKVFFKHALPILTNLASRLTG